MTPTRYTRATPEQRQQHLTELRDLLEQLHKLRSDIQDLNAREAELTQRTKALLMAGYYTTTDSIKPVLRQREEIRYDYQRFLGSFGESLTRQVTIIDPKAVRGLIRHGLLKEQDVLQVATTKAMTPALSLQPLAAP